MTVDSLVWEKCDFTFRAGFITTFDDQETCGRIAIVNGRTKLTPSATASLGIFWGGGVGLAGPGRVGEGKGVAGEHLEMCRTVCNVSE